MDKRIKMITIMLVFDFQLMYPALSSSSHHYKAKCYKKITVLE